jgi:hypothetical protein
MKIDSPFLGSRKRTLFRYYNVEPKQEPSSEESMGVLRRLFWLGVGLLVTVWLFWPNK